MSNSIQPQLLATVTAALLGLTGCGGGGDSASSGPSAEGVYGGALTGSTSSYFETIVLENDEFWLLYGTRTSTMFLVSGFIQGSGTSSNGTFQSASLKDYGLVPPAAGTVSATYNADNKTIAGSSTFPGRSVGFNGGPIAGTSYNYATPASLATISGNWTVTVNTGESATISIGPTGNVTLVSALGCSATGTVVPRASGKNVYNVAITFGTASCALPGRTLNGLAVAYPLANGRTQLIAGGRDAGQTAGLMVFGTR